METAIKTFNVEKARQAQERYQKEKKYPHFAPADGNCWNCRNNIYRQLDKVNSYASELTEYKTGISVEQAGSELITGCLHCNWSYCE